MAQDAPAPPGQQAADLVRACQGQGRHYVHAVEQQWDTALFAQIDFVECTAYLAGIADMNAVAKVEEHIADATAKGASIATGGARHELGGSFYLPTILTGVTQEMAVAREETFGPVAPLFSFDTEEDVIAMSNDTEFGLAGYFYARDLGRVWRVGEALESGIVGINTGIISTEVGPFGGVKQSGLGREGSHHGIEDYLEMKYICMSV